jgi:hypothetical protein
LLLEALNALEKPSLGEDTEGIESTGDTGPSGATGKVEEPRRSCLGCPNHSPICRLKCRHWAKHENEKTKRYAAHALAIAGEPVHKASIKSRNRNEKERSKGRIK